MIQYSRQFLAIPKSKSTTSSQSKLNRARKEDTQAKQPCTPIQRQPSLFLPLTMQHVMHLVCYFVLIFAVADTRSPVISLNFEEEMIIKEYPSPLKQEPHPKEIPAGKLPSAAKNEVCPAGSGNNMANCKTPTARSFDHHHDGAINIMKTIFLTNLEGTFMDEQVESINFGAVSLVSKSMSMYAGQF